MPQTIITGPDGSDSVAEILKQENAHRFLLVCGCSYSALSNRETLDRISIPRIRFSDFTPNPLYEQVEKGIALFNEEGCDAIVAVGGGSAMDVAKCIKLYCRTDPSQSFLEQTGSDTGIPLIAVPTTAGTGSESTRYAVIYYEGKKQSVAHESILPNYVVLDPKVLLSLPIYQKKCTMLDALCQAIESWWSVHSTEESITYSKQAIERIIANKSAYLEQNTLTSAKQIMLAANYAGRAINITATTAAHAMSYKLTSMYHLPHGHAVAVCLPQIWRYMIKHMDVCADARGAEYVNGVFHSIASALGCATVVNAIERFFGILDEMDIMNPTRRATDDIDLLTASVNLLRLQNNPVRLSEPALHDLYEAIVE